MGMIKTVLALLTAGVLVTGSAFAGGKSCCSSGTRASNEKANCMNLASLHLSADQNSKLVAWQNECMKAGCTKESRTAFMKKAKAILSADQYAALKSECDKTMTKKS
jgi:hypothetical protein